MYFIDIDISNEDVHSIASLLKLFFRELPDSIFPSTIYVDILYAKRNNTGNLANITSSLDRPSRETLTVLLDLLARVALSSVCLL